MMTVCASASAFLYHSASASASAAIDYTRLSFRTQQPLQY
jgi:hypothetical protein